MDTMIAYAAGNSSVAGITCGGGINNLTDFINYFTCTLMNAVVPLLMALAVASFVYGIIQFFLNPENEEKKKAGKSYMMWGLITLFVMVSIWGLVGILSSSFIPGSKPLLPSLPQ